MSRGQGLCFARGAVGRTPTDGWIIPQPTFSQSVGPCLWCLVWFVLQAILVIIRNIATRQRPVRPVRSPFTLQGGYRSRHADKAGTGIKYQSCQLSSRFRGAQGPRRSVRKRGKFREVGMVVRPSAEPNRAHPTDRWCCWLGLFTIVLIYFC